MKAKTNNNTSRTLEAAMKEVQKEETSLIGFRVPTTIHKKLKSKVVDNDTSIQDVLDKFIRSYIDNK